MTKTTDLGIVTIDGTTKGYLAQIPGEWLPDGAKRRGRMRVTVEWEQVDELREWQGWRT